MLSCLSANALLKSVVAAMATIVVVLLGLSSWDAWQSLAVAGRTTVVAEASAYAFKAMHNLRTDRSTTMRSVNDPETIKPEVADRLKGIREAEMPALASAIAGARRRRVPGQGHPSPQPQAGGRQAEQAAGRDLGGGDTSRRPNAAPAWPTNTRPKRPR